MLNTTSKTAATDAAQTSDAQTHDVPTRAITPSNGGFSLIPAWPANTSRPWVHFANDVTGWDKAFVVMQDVWKNEETRFNNLNTRALGIVTASSLVTAIINFFAKDLFASSTKPLSGEVQTRAEATVVCIMALLIATVALVVFLVLKPGGRGGFGNNDFTGTIAENGGLGQGLDGTADSILKTAATEYAGLYVSLAERNRWKAYWLSWAYITFAIAVIATALLACYIVVNA
jgi:hypothetical protein